MPTVLRKSGFSFKINIHDHEPMHVHVWKQGRQVLINFEDTVSMRKNYGMNQNEIRQAINIVVENQEFLQVKWREIYG
ncbi:MAG: DUF4160 domain-containing protein [Acidobacteria bacterium]|jgi:hypothetical protein|nr:DUF4160 domain-containing protein [Acidobacteriota bacterium]